MIKKMILASKTLNLPAMKIRAVKATALILVLKATHPPLLMKLRRASKRAEMSRLNPNPTRRISKTGKRINPKLANSKARRATKAKINLAKILLRLARTKVSLKNSHSSLV
ncbi:hypothetical protein GYA13_01210 [Candidatus Kuenenbacteria bacterium]|nr:hypothetical protein [Candidatus Kuenenbacteria bacterium]